MAQFRDLAEAQDLGTDRGRRVYLALMDMAGAFAGVSGGGGAAAGAPGRAGAGLQNVAYGNYTAAQVNQLSGTSFSTVSQGLGDIPGVHLATGVDLTRFQDTRGGTVTPMQIVQTLNQLGVAGSGVAYDYSRQAAIGVLAANGVTDSQGNILASAQVPKYDGGGLASSGWAVVGESGPELVDFGSPGRVYTAEQTRAAMGGGGEVVEELRQVKAILAGLLSSSAAGATASKKTADLLRNVTRDGQSLLTTAA